MQDATNPASPLGRLVHGAARATSLFSSLLDQDVQRRHDLLMKHGHPLPGNSLPTLIHCAAVITVALIAGATAVTIMAMTVYQGHVIRFTSALD